MFEKNRMATTEDSNMALIDGSFGCAVGLALLLAEASIDDTLVFFTLPPGATTRLWEQ